MESNEPTKPSQPTLYLCDQWDCHNFTGQYCNKCELAYYCCKEHQKACWSQHRLVCSEEGRAIDLLALAALVCKTVELLDPRMNTLVYLEQSLKERPSVKGGTEVTIRLTTGNHSIHTREAFHKVALEYAPVDLADPHSVATEEEKTQLLQEKANQLGQPLTMSYWALRCMCSGLTLNLTLFDVLQTARAQGCKRLVYSSELELSLLQEPRLELVRVKPRHWVHVEIDGSVQKAQESQLHYVIVLGGYAIDLSAGQFWCFETSKVQRPLIVTQQHLYNMILGELVDDLGQLDRVKELENRRNKAIYAKQATDMVLASLGLFQEEPKVQEV